MTRARDVLNLDGDRGVVALLGPTNTGKTHRALERLLAHPTGVIGFPLRLLAREVYDRLVALRGTDSVALVTGEEKRIPPRARHFVCTVEAMPVDRPFAFVAVDEIQLAADPGRGHVFTDRLLRARGVHETMWLGSDTMAPMLAQLAPGVRIEQRPRLSALRGAPPKKLGSMPPRSAIIAFSAKDVYAIAERLRARFGGVAVVLGALSPRARNAQIAMYQSGEVEHVVATDAIGMGLNLDIDHVAFSATRKFDGERPRDLRPAELGQIAGRAGRGPRDGTFGATTDHGPLDPDVVAAIEAQRFDPVTALFWRNPDLDLSDIDALRASLEVGPRTPGLLRKRDADDHRALERLVLSDEVVRRARGRAAVGLLWDVCSVPDFAKSPVVHANLLERFFVLLVDYGRIPRSFVDGRMDNLDRVEGDIDLLVSRIAGVRTFAFLAHRAGWVEDPDALRERARDVEERLSDALHAQLTRRFVDPRAVIAVRPDAHAGTAWLDDADQARVGDAVLGRLVGLSWRPATGLTLSGRALEALIAPLVAARVEAWLDAPDEAVEIRPDGVVAWRGGPLGVLEAGPDLASPKIRLARLDLLAPGARERARRRLLAWLSGHVTRADEGPAGAASRGLLWAVHHDVRPIPLAPAGVYDAVAGRPRAWWDACGYVVIADRAVRRDVADAIASRLHGAAVKGVLDPPDALAGWLRIDPADVPEALRALGWRPRGDGRWVRSGRASAGSARGS